MTTTPRFLQPVRETVALSVEINVYETRQIPFPVAPISNGRVTGGAQLDWYETVTNGPSETEAGSHNQGRTTMGQFEASRTKGRGRARITTASRQAECAVPQIDVGDAEALWEADYDRDIHCVIIKGAAAPSPPDTILRAETDTCRFTH
jgi:hypothetical protein